MDEARILIDQISTSQARAAAVEAALSLSPRGVSAAAIGEWCDLLDGNSAPRCRLTWGLASQ